MNSARPVRLALSPSPALATLIVCLHAIAAACFLAVLTGWIAAATAALVVALGAAAAWDRALLGARRSPRAIEVRPSGEAFPLSDASTALGRLRAGTLQGAAVLIPA